MSTNADGVMQRLSITELQDRTDHHSGLRSAEGSLEEVAVESSCKERIFLRGEYNCFTKLC